MKTAAQFNSVTAILPSYKTVSKPNTQENIKLHAGSCNAFSTV
jgi:hypothetical protein